jgi:hypothetical protein
MSGAFSTPRRGWIVAAIGVAYIVSDVPSGQEWLFGLGHYGAGAVISQSGMDQEVLWRSGQDSNLRPAA